MEKNKSKDGSFGSLILVFGITSVILFVGWLSIRDPEWVHRIGLILAGNTLLFLCTWFSFSLYSRALPSKNTHYFLRMMYSSLLVKMLLCAGGALTYGLLAGGRLDRTVIFSFFGLYILYTVLEVKVLMRMSKLQKNA